MTVIARTMYTAKCDYPGCGIESSEFEGSLADDYGWLAVGDKHYCGEHVEWGDEGYTRIPKAHESTELDAGPLGSGHSPRATGRDVGDCGGSVEEPSTHLIHGPASAHEPTDQWVTAPDGEEFLAGACQGHSACPVDRHEHGCFADDGTNCDHPEDHEPTEQESP